MSAGNGTQRLKIALVGLTYPFRGGISHYTTLLARALSTAHDVRFYALYRQYPRLLFPGRTQFDHSNTSLRVPHEACIDSVNPLTWLFTARRILRFKPDLIVFSWWHPFFAPAFGTIAHLARWLGGVPSCFLCHNAVPHERTMFDMALLRYAFSGGRVFISHSQQDHDDLRTMRPDAIVHRNPHPTYEIFKPESLPSAAAAKERLGLQDKKVLLFFGFVRKYKGLAHLLEAVRELDPAEGYHLVVVGEFYEEPESYAALLDALSARGQLTLVDRYVPNEDVPLYFSAADLVMVPYLSATQSGVVQMAYGFLKPVVATAVGGLPEVVADGRTGYLVPPADAPAMARAVRDYFDGERREEFVRAIELENHKYSWDRMVETVERVREELAAQSRAKGS
jgi:glycosyltransferase involved in cell wall biosynthesis